MKKRIAVVTGRHVFEVTAFHQMLRGLDEFDFYVQHMEDFAADIGKDRDRYEAVVFFHMLEGTPTGHEPWPANFYRGAIEQIPQRSQGIMVLHHGLVAWQDWPLWSDIVGIPNRNGNKVAYCDVSLQVADPEHAITNGLADWVMNDETYLIDEPGEDSHVLFRTNTPGSMKALAWTRHVGKAPIVLPAERPRASRLDESQLAETFPAIATLAHISELKGTHDRGTRHRRPRFRGRSGGPAGFSDRLWSTLAGRSMVGSMSPAIRRPTPMDSARM